MSVWTAVAGAVAAIPAILKKNKKYVLWYQGLDAVWRKKSGPMSYRACRKTRRALMTTGKYQIDRFVILRDGVAP